MRNDDYVFNYDPNEDAWSTDLAALDISRSERFLIALWI